MTEPDDEGLTHEEVERRKELRGSANGLRIAFGPPIDGSFAALEASRRSFFISAEEPDRFGLGEVLEARVGTAARAATCRLEVIRKEIVPRRGVALRLVHIDPANEQTLHELLGPLAEV